MGPGVPADVAEAKKWWALAAAQGHDKATRLLAALAPEASEADRPAAEVAATDSPEADETGEVASADEAGAAATEKDAGMDEAELAALSGRERLAAGVAAYRNGDYGAAVAAWLLLAEAGHAWAQFYIGGLYHDGNGMAADLARAHMWWALAARRGHQGARDLMAALEPKMDANALAKAAALTAAWKPRE